MHDKVNVIQQHPVGLLVAFDRGGADSRLSESLLYLIRDGLNLPRVATRTDDEKIRERSGGLIHLQHGDFFGLFGLGCLYGFQQLGHGWVLLGHRESWFWSTFSLLLQRCFAMIAHSLPLCGREPCRGPFFECTPPPPGRPATPAYDQCGPQRESGWRKFFHARQAAGATSRPGAQYPRPPVDALAPWRPQRPVADSLAATRLRPRANNLA